jgi:hypothetical protein
VSPALVVATLALLVALGGTSYAVSQLPANSVGTRQLQNRAVTPQKLSLTTFAFVRAQRSHTSVLFAESSGGTTPTLLYGNGVKSVTWQSTYYVVTFKRTITTCAPFGATTGTNGNNNAAYISVVHTSGGPTMLNVRTFDSSDTSVSTIPFTIAVLC